MLNQVEIKELAEHLGTVIQEAQQRLYQIRRMCKHPEMQPLPNQRMGMALSSIIYYCPDCLLQEDRDY